MLYLVAFNATNALNYAYLVAMGLLLGTESYGLFGALFGLVYLASALGNTVQVAVAKQIAHLHSVQGGLSRRDILASFLPAGLVAVLVALAFLVASPLISRSLDASAALVLWAGVAAGLSVLVPAGYGALQGAQRFGALGASQIVASVSRVAVGVALVAAGWGPTGALAGVAIGYLPSGLVALLYAGRAVRTGDGTAVRVQAPSLRSLVAILIASVAIAAPTSIDVALVKHFLSATEAGHYTAIAVMGRVVLFVPLAISFIALPKVTQKVAQGQDPTSLLWRSIGQSAGLAGGTAALLVLMVAGLGWSPIGGEISPAAGALYWYLPAMIAFALVVPSIYYQIGCGNVRYLLVLLIPGMLAQTLAVLLFHGSIMAVARALLSVNLLLLVASLLPTLLPLSRQSRLAQPYLSRTSRSRTRA